MSRTHRAGHLGFALAATFALPSAACGGGAGAAPDAPAPDGLATGDCAELDVVPIAEGLVDAHPCRAWIEAVRGRVGAFALIGSFTVMSRRTTSELGVVISAAHTQGGGAFGPTGAEVTAALTPPASTGTLLLKIPAPDGSLGLGDLSPMYVMFHDDIPAAENNPSLTAIRPRHDFFVAVVDAQRIPFEEGAFPVPDERIDGPIALHDPSGRTTSDVRVGDAVEGDQVMLVGYPQVGPATGAFSVGRVLTEAEAVAVLAELADAGDEEGSIPYDPEAEFLVDAVGLAGMSGGGVFAADGRYLGNMVRASSTAAAPTIVRVVRVTFVAGRLAPHVQGSPTPQQVLPYIDEGMMTP